MSLDALYKWDDELLLLSVDYQLLEMQALVVRHMVKSHSARDTIYFAFLAQRASSDTLFQVYCHLPLLAETKLTVFRRVPRRFE